MSAEAPVNEVAATPAAEASVPQANGQIAPEPFAVRLSGLGRIAKVTDLATDLFDRSREDMLGVASASMVDPRDVNATREFFADVVANPGQRRTMVARLRVAGGSSVASELVGMNQGSVDVPDVLMTFRPKLPAPPGAVPDPEPEPVVVTTPQTGAKSESCCVSETVGLDSLRGCVAEMDRLLNANLLDFVLLMVETKPSSVPDDEVGPELITRLDSSTRDTDHIYRVSPLRQLIIVRGVQNREEIGIVMDRITSALAFPYTNADGVTGVFHGRIGLAMPRNAITGESLIHFAQTQLAAANGAGPGFGWSVETRALERE